MGLMLLSSIPLAVLLLWGRRLSGKSNFWLGILSIPFFIQLAFYGLILGIGLVVAFTLVWQLQKWRAKRNFKKNPVEILYNTRR